MKPKIETVVNVMITAIILILFIFSISASWYRYIANENFRYFLTAEEAPDRLDFSTY